MFIQSLTFYIPYFSFYQIQSIATPAKSGRIINVGNSGTVGVDVGVGVDESVEKFDEVKLAGMVTVCVVLQSLDSAGLNVI